MRDYYQVNDDNEIKRMHDAAKIKLTEMIEAHAFTIEFCETANLEMMPHAPDNIDKTTASPEAMAEHTRKMVEYNRKRLDWEPKAVIKIEAMLKAELEKKRSNRMPFVIVPDEPKSLGI